MLDFSTKAGTLAKLQDRIKSACILPLVYFTVNAWKKNPAKYQDKIALLTDKTRYIVRSSCKAEDCLSRSNAGAFLSLADVRPENIAGAVEKVIQAYGRLNGDDEVLIQPMLENVVRSGVALSHDPNTCTPYRMISWSDGGNTAAVTGGAQGHIWQQAALSPVQQPHEHRGVIRLLNELLDLFGNQPVDCEFAVTHKEGKERLWLLQARPLILDRPPESEKVQFSKLIQIQDKISLGVAPHPFVMGQRTVYGIMPDWNPAEIIGIRPKPLALSLYRELITDSIWAYQRHNYGYRNLRSFPLMPHFFGLPYIDMRLSFNSFIPADLDDRLSGRLVDYYLGKILEEPALHDKIEFEIVFSCYTLDLPNRLRCLGDKGFTRSEQKKIADSLKSLTNRIIHSKTGLWRQDADKLDILNSRREALARSNVDTLERIYWLIEDAKRYGTLPFAGLARAGFVSVQMLKSMTSVGILSQNDYEAFLNSLSTVSSKLARDRAVLDKNSFLSRYGHLRPGTYDILSPRYDESPDLYFDWEQRPIAPEPVRPFSLTQHQMQEIVLLLKHHGLEPDAVGLFDFIQAGIELRELAKFHFTRNLSDALVLIGDYGRQKGLSLEDLAYSDISVFKELHMALADPDDILLKSIEQGRERYQTTLGLSLPPLIANPEDVWAFEWPQSLPNFITQKQVTAPVTGCVKTEYLAGAVVCITNADPGHDWLFTYPIAGLITAWGGANSHMAIRAGELGLPAVIGAGEVLYRQWSNAKHLHIDCPGRRVTVLV